MDVGVPLPNKHGKDVSDWFEAGHDADELLTIVGNTPNWSPDDSATAESQLTTVNDSQSKTSLAIVCLADVQQENVRWLWFPYIALGKVTILEGEEGIGKSSAICALAAAISTGCGFPPEFVRTDPGKVLMLSAEDGLADTIKPRLVAFGADTSRVFAVNEPLALDEKGLIKLESYIAEVEPKLVTIDPIFAFTPARTDINSPNQSRAISAALAAIGEKWDCAILPVRHIGKAKGFGDPRVAGLGSIDWRAAARSVLLVGKNPDDERERAIVQTKNNLAPLGAAIGFTIVGDAKGAEFCWTGVSSLTASRILAAVTDEDTRLEQSDAVDFLRQALRDGEQEAGALTAEAEKLGITRKQLRTARKKLGVTTKKHGGGFSKDEKQCWMWSLPDAAAEGNLANTEDAQHEL